VRRAHGGDPIARRVVREAQEALAALVVGVARARRLRAPITVSWAGGLLANASFRAGVWRHLRRGGLRVRTVRPRAAAATPGAWRALLRAPHPRAPHPTLLPGGERVSYARAGARQSR
jgi:hypothetical protein